MKEILFKGKSVEDDEWMYGYYCNTGYGDCCFPCILPMNDDQHVCWAIDQETVCQFIDIINGLRIFHHDIVKAYKYGNLESDPFINEITYKNGTYWFGNWTWIEFLQAFRYIEVIGNIHDNPEMLIK
jgi:hypothetical protein